MQQHIADSVQEDGPHAGHMEAGCADERPERPDVRDVPGRILIPETMETVTLAWRMVAVPLATFALWVWLLRWAATSRWREQQAPARG